MASMSAVLLAGASRLPSRRASSYRERCAKNPTAGSSEKTFCRLAVMVIARAMAASNWFAVPNRGYSWLMPPSGSVTPTHRK